MLSRKPLLRLVRVSEPLEKPSKNRSKVEPLFAVLCVLASVAILLWSLVFLLEQTGHH